MPISCNRLALLAMATALSVLAPFEGAEAKPHAQAKVIGDLTKSSSTRGSSPKARSARTSASKGSRRSATADKYPSTRASLKPAPSAQKVYRRVDQTNSRDSTSDNDNPRTLEVVSLRRSASGISLMQVPRLQSTFLNRIAGVTPHNDFVFFTIDPKLQRLTEELVKESKSPHVAVVVMNPVSGRILAIADKSPTIQHLAFHADFPAASLFKVVTAAAAVENAAVDPTTTVNFRGGTYTLNEFNYMPDPRRDRRSMSVAEALGRSCNPVFAHLALKYLDQRVIRSYAEQFGFNEQLPFDAPLKASLASVPGDEYGFSRTAAGFGEVTLSPIHAAALMSGIANKGLLPRPYLVDRIVSPTGDVLYRAVPQPVRRIVKPQTAETLLDMMEFTTTMGTSRREFMRKSGPVLGKIDVAAKTGTLKGENPEGINNWFIAAAPKESPEIAIAVIVVKPSGVSTHASRIGRELLQAYFSE